MRNRAEQQPVAAIKDVILHRGLRPGDPMPTEAELVEELGISRSSVREAIRTLVALDIVDVRHGRGTFVGQMSLRPLVEGMVFRGMLMPGVGFQALRDVIEVRQSLDLALADGIVAGAREDEAALRAEVEGMKACAARGIPFTEHDRQFHLCLAEGVGNMLYSQLVAAFWDIHQLVAPKLGVVTQRALTDSAATHEAMLDAAVAGDVAAFRDCIAGHYGPILSSVRAA